MLDAVRTQEFDPCEGRIRTLHLPVGGVLAYIIPHEPFHQAVAVDRQHLPRQACRPAVRRHRVPGRSAPRTAASRAQPQNLRPCAGRVSTCRPAPRREYPAWRPKPRPAWHVSSTSRPPHASRCRAPRRRSSRPYATPPKPCRNRNRVSWCGYSSPPSTADPPWPRPPSAANTP